jgi:hypothetical protein
MKTRLTLALAALALALPATALGKGPSVAKIEGPGLSSPITFRGLGEGPGSKLGNFADRAGFFPSMFGQSPNPMLPGTPKGSLGPRYRVAYTVPTGGDTADTIRQDLYPYAAGGPVAYMKPGQQVFGTQHTIGGWFRALPSLKTMLAAEGLPARAPKTGHSLAGFGTLPIALVAGILLALAAAVVAVRRGVVTIGRWPRNRSTSDT